MSQGSVCYFGTKSPAPLIGLLHMSKHLIEPWRTGMSVPQLGPVQSREMQLCVPSRPGSSPSPVQPASSIRPNPNHGAPALPPPVLFCRPAPHFNSLPVSSPTRHDPSTADGLVLIRELCAHCADAIPTYLDNPKSPGTPGRRSPMCEGGKVEKQESADVERQQARGR